MLRKVVLGTDFRRGRGITDCKEQINKTACSEVKSAVKLPKQIKLRNWYSSA